MAVPRTSLATHLRSVSEHTYVGAYAFGAAAGTFAHTKSSTRDRSAFFGGAPP